MQRRRARTWIEGRSIFCFPSTIVLTPYQYCLGGDGDALDFYEGVLGEAGDLDGGAGGRGDAFGGEVLGVEGVHSGEVGHVFEEDGGLDDVGEVEACGG